MLKKADIIIFLSVLSAAVLCFAVYKIAFSASGNTVVITQNNSVVYNGSLYKDKTVKLTGNIVKIKDGSVDMTDADCKNQICVNHSKITRKGETIVCLPNRVIVEIK